MFTGQALVTDFSLKTNPCDRPASPGPQAHPQEPREWRYGARPSQETESRGMGPNHPPSPNKNKSSRVGRLIVVVVVVVLVLHKRDAKKGCLGLVWWQPHCHWISSTGF